MGSISPPSIRLTLVMMCGLESSGGGGLSPQWYLGLDNLGPLAGHPRAQLQALGHALPKHHAPFQSE